MKTNHPLALFSFCPQCGSSQFKENNTISKRCHACSFTYYFNPKAAVAAIIVNENGELLVSRRAHDPAKGTLDLPGGFTDSYETAEQAVAREVKEETGLDLTTFQYLFSAPNIYSYSGLDVHTMDLFFLSQVSSTQHIKANDDVAELYFLSPAQINPDHFGLHSIRTNMCRILQLIAKK